MNDIEKAFAYRDEELQMLRDNAKKHLPKLAELINTMPEKDREFVSFVQGMVDYYMANECQLGRINAHTG